MESAVWFLKLSIKIQMSTNITHGWSLRSSWVDLHKISRNLYVQKCRNVALSFQLPLRLERLGVWVVFKSFISFQLCLLKNSYAFSEGVNTANHCWIRVYWKLLFIIDGFQTKTIDHSCLKSYLEGVKKFSSQKWISCLTGWGQNLSTTHFNKTNCVDLVSYIWKYFIT